MDTTATPKLPVDVLLEMRPALSGNAGIPQENRLLFRCLAELASIRVTGLLQNSERVLAKGLPVRRAGSSRSLSADQQLNRLGQVVITLEQGSWSFYLQAVAHTVAMALWHMLGGRQRLTRFDASHFRDFIWRKLFGRTLPPDDFALVTDGSFRVARVPWIAMHICALVMRRLGYALYPRLDTSEFDVMITETPYPATVSRTTQLVVRYHDAIPLLMPHTISDRRFHQASHYRALRKNVRSGAWFVCVSDATRKDLLSIFPEVQERCVTIHNVVSHHYYDEDSRAERVAEIIRTRLNTSGELWASSGEATRALLEVGVGSEPFDYLLIVATVEPRKNHLTLLSAWERLRRERYPGLKLLMVGGLGWHHDDIVRKFRPWTERGDAFFLEDVSAAELRLLYKQARATVCPSFGEGFGLPGVEAMASGGVVVASNIAVHREIYGDAAQYFSPYSSDELSAAIREVGEPSSNSRRETLITKGKARARLYSREVILPQWESFLSARARQLSAA